MPKVTINQLAKRLEIGSFETENQILFNYFDKIPAADREDKLFKALYIGVLALMEDRLSAFLAKTSNELGTELENLKIIFDMKKELFYKTAVKGTIAEQDVAAFLSEFLSESRLSDKVSLTGGMAGKIAKNKTGDIVSYVDGRDDIRIVIECKFDKGVRLGDIHSKDVFARKTDTAWNQLIEAQANRDGKIALIVFDASLADSSILNAVQNVKYVPAVGFVVVVDSLRGEYKNLAIAYMLARDIAVNAKEKILDGDVLSIIVSRIVKDVDDILSIRTLVHANIENSKRILLQLDKSMLSMEFSQRYMKKFLVDGHFSREDLLDFYSGDEIRNRYRALEKEIKSL